MDTIISVDPSVPLHKSITTCAKPLMSTKYFLIFQLFPVWSGLNHRISVAKRLEGGSRCTIFVRRTHLIHRGSSSQKTPRPGWPPVPTRALSGRQMTNVRSHDNSCLQSSSDWNTWTFLITVLKSRGLQTVPTFIKHNLQVTLLCWHVLIVALFEVFAGFCNPRMTFFFILAVMKSCHAHHFKIPQPPSPTVPMLVLVLYN